MSVADVSLRPPLDLVLGALAHHGPDLLATRFQPRCCIAATKLSIAVLGGAGYAAHPVAFWARAGNRAFVDNVGKDLDEQALAAAGARYVEIDFDGPDFPAHLCAVVNGNLVDLSAGQFDRPHKAIHVPKWVCLEMPYDWANGVEFGKQLDDGGMIAYRKLHVPPDHTQAPDWRPERTAQMAHLILREIAGAEWI